MYWVVGFLVQDLGNLPIVLMICIIVRICFNSDCCVVIETCTKPANYHDAVVAKLCYCTLRTFRSASFMYMPNSNSKVMQGYPCMLHPALQTALWLPKQIKMLLRFLMAKSETSYVIKYEKRDHFAVKLIIQYKQFKITSTSYCT